MFIPSYVHVPWFGRHFQFRAHPVVYGKPPFHGFVHTILPRYVELRGAQRSPFPPASTALNDGLFGGGGMTNPFIRHPDSTNLGGFAMYRSANYSWLFWLSPEKSGLIISMKNFSNSDQMRNFEYIRSVVTIES